MQNTTQKHRTQRGFTLVETLVAITILLVATVGPITIAARGLQSSFYAKDQLSAVYLAQEGIELVRIAREQHAMANAGLPVGENWFDDVMAGKACAAAGGCGLDARSLSDGILADTELTRSCTTLANCRLSYHGTLSTARGMYSYEAGGTPSPYTRKIEVAQVGGNSREVKVTVTVSWEANMGLGTRSVVLTSHLFNRYDKY